MVPFPCCVQELKYMENNSCESENAVMLQMDIVASAMRSGRRGCGIQRVCI